MSRSRLLENRLCTPGRCPCLTRKVRNLVSNGSKREHERKKRERSVNLDSLDSKNKSQIWGRPPVDDPKLVQSAIRGYPLQHDTSYTDGIRNDCSNDDDDDTRNETRAMRRSVSHTHRGRG